MAKISNKEISKWTGLIKLSEEERKKQQPNWDKLNEFYRGLQWDEARKKNNDLITVNLVYSQIKVILPSIYFNNPHLYFSANKPTAINRARIMEAVTNKDMEIMDLKTTMRKVTLDTLLVGTGFTKTTYYVDEEAGNPQEAQGDRGQVLSLVDRFKEGPFLPATGNKLQIPKNGPQVERISPYDIRTMIGVHDIDDPGFIAQKIRKRLEVVKNDSWYQNTKDLQPTTKGIDTPYRGNLKGFWNNDYNDYVDVVDLWEIWDVERQEFFVIAEGHDQYLREPATNPYPYPHPFDVLRFSLVPDQLWGISEIDPWIGQQEEVNKFRTMVMGLLGNYARKILVRQNSIMDEEEEEALIGPDNVVVHVQGDVNTDVKELQYGDVPAELWQWMNTLKDDIVEIGGVTPYKRGLLKGANTATEANIAESNSNIRDHDRTDTLASFVKRFMHKVRLCRQEFTPGDYIIQLTDDVKGAQEWEAWSKDTFQADVEMSVEFGSDFPISAQQKRADAQTLYAALITNATINPQALAVDLLQAFGKKDLTSYFLPPEILQQQMLNTAMANQQEQKGVSPQTQGQAPTPAPAAGSKAPAPGGPQPQRKSA